MGPRGPPGINLKFDVNFLQEKNFIPFIFLQVLPDWMDVPVVTERMASPALALAQMVNQELQAHLAYLALLALTERKVLQVNPEFQPFQLFQFFHLLARHHHAKCKFQFLKFQ
jgi:hypothetical protein